MGLPVFGVENFFNVRQFPKHLITADQEDTGREAFRVADGRRSKLDFWAATTANVVHEVEVDSTVVSGLQADYFALDRGHNLAGKIVRLQRSTDGIAWVDITGATPTIPATPGGQVADANGCHTDEGAFITTFGVSTLNQYLRLRVDAMGAGLTPRVVGLWAGLRWDSGNIFLPLTDEDDLLISQRTQSSKGWSASTVHVRKRVGDLIFKLPDAAAFTAAAKNIRDNFGRGRLMWIVHDSANSQRAVLAQRPLGRAGFSFPTDFSNRTAQVAWEEYEPLVELPGT